jgi:hypothetical protein
MIETKPMTLSRFTKRTARHTVQIAVGAALIKSSFSSGKKKMEEPQAPAQTGSKYDFGVYKSTIVRVSGVISSFVELTLKNGLEVDPYLMSEAQDILNGFQELIEFKKQYDEMKAQNGN